MNSTTRRDCIFEVLNENVDLGGGIHLPVGRYRGYCTYMHVPMRGQMNTQLARAMLPMSEDFLRSLGFPPSSNTLGLETDLSVDVYKGNVRII